MYRFWFNYIAVLAVSLSVYGAVALGGLWTEEKQVMVLMQPECEIYVLHGNFPFWLSAVTYSSTLAITGEDK